VWSRPCHRPGWPVGARRVERLYGVASLDGFGAFEEAEVSALGLVAAYLETTQAGKIPALAPPRRSGEAGFLAIDPATRLSLEIDRTQRGERDGSLLACIDRLPGGARPGERIARPCATPPPSIMDSMLLSGCWSAAICAATCATA
jgi:DNA mismatch repair protein MutS